MQAAFPSKPTGRHRPPSQDAHTVSIIGTAQTGFAATERRVVFYGLKTAPVWRIAVANEVIHGLPEEIFQ